MQNIILPEGGAAKFFRDTKMQAYGMEESLISPQNAAKVSQELADHGLLRDLLEGVSTSVFADLGMSSACMLLEGLRLGLDEVEGQGHNLLNEFSVRVFPPGMHATTVHRNHYAVRPYAAAVTLAGEAPFNVYTQDQLRLTTGATIDLHGDDRDPTPTETLNTKPGSGWGMYTEREQVPHSGGLVADDVPRQLLIVYDTRW